MTGDRDTLDDADLLAAVKRGEEAAFTCLVVRHQRSLINFFFHLSWDRAMAEDCAQEVFLRLYSHRETYQPQARFTTFLFRIARNLWIDRVRSAAVHGKPASLDGLLQDRVASPAPGPVEILTRRETGAALKRALEKLSEEQRAVVLLGEIQGLKYEEVGAILEIPVGTVKSRMHTALEKLHVLLADPDL